MTSSSMKRLIRCRRTQSRRIIFSLTSPINYVPASNMRGILEFSAKYPHESRRSEAQAQKNLEESFDADVSLPSPRAPIEPRLNNVAFTFHSSVNAPFNNFTRYPESSRWIPAARTSRSPTFLTSRTMLLSSQAAHPASAKWPLKASSRTELQSSSQVARSPNSKRQQHG